MKYPEAAQLRRGIRQLLSKPVPRHALALPGQPFDSALLRASRLFRRSRELFLKSGGSFAPSLLSSPRSLGSPALLSSRIEYSPIEAELLWAATDPIESRKDETLLRLRTFSTSLFHEQNHRVLWKLLPRAPSAAVPLRRFLNLAESLVIASDMALGDELGPERARTFYLAGVSYDPGTRLREAELSRRQIRNYLQAAMHATYLHLEGFDASDIPRAIHALFPQLGSLADRASARAGKLDSLFISRTNLSWQRRNQKAAVQALARGKSPALNLPSDPMDNREAYLIAERWFETLGL